MLVVGLYMTELSESDPFRYTLTQWHKSFGVITLLLITWRVFWRLTHPAPTLPENLKPWEKQLAGLNHLLLYAMILIIPVSGWIMVSASPLELPTLVFNKIPWMHLPPFDSLPNKEETFRLFGRVHAISAQFDSLPNKEETFRLFGRVHAISAQFLILLLAAHIGAVLRHRFMLHDGVMERMSPKAPDGRWVAGTRSTFGAILLIVSGLGLYSYIGSAQLPLTSAGKSLVHFEFTVQNQTQQGSFAESTVDMMIDRDTPTNNRLQATVYTSTVSTGNAQIDATLIDEDWFDPTNHPRAIFNSLELVPLGEGSYSASGILSIKGIAREFSFPVDLTDSGNKRVAQGSLTINRLDFKLGLDTQPDDKMVGYLVTIKFRFEVL